MSKIKDKKIEVREIVYCQDEEKSFGDVFIYEPENIEEQNLGNLFIVGELKDLPRNCSYIMNVLASKIKKEFYANTKRTTEESLEAGLSEANQTLADLAEQGNGEYVGKLSMICGTYCGNKFYLSQIGKIKSLLIRGGQIMEIVKEDSAKRVSAKRAFNNIASGELSDGDLVMFATSGLFNIFSLEALRQLGSSMKLDEFSTKLQEEIEEEDSETVSALIIEIEGEKKKIIERSEIALEEKETPRQSLEKALTEGVTMKEAESPAAGEGEAAPAAEVDKTEEIVHIPEESSAAAETSPDETRIKTEEAADAEEATKEQEKPIIERKSAAVSEVQIESPVVGQETAAAAGAGAAAAKEAGKISLSDIIREYEKMESKSMQQDVGRDRSIEEMVAKKEANNFEDLDEHKESLPKKIAGGAKNYILSLKSGEPRALLSAGKLRNLLQSKKEYTVKNPNRKLPLAGKKMAVAALIILIAIGGYYYDSLKTKNEKAAKASAYQALLADSKAKMDQAEVEIISGSEENAGDLYVQARALALRVKNEYDALDAQADQIIASAQSEIDKIDKVEKVSDPAVLASYANENIRNLVEIKGTYYAVDDSDNAVYRVDAAQGQISQVAQAQDKLSGKLMAKNFQSQEILLSNGTDFSSFNLKNSQVQKLSSKADGPFTDFATYGRYVYLLSPASNQIYKYQKTAQGLDGKAEWLKSGDIKNAIALTIDQNVYILTSDGQVKKYFTGEEYTDKDGNKFALKQPSDAITNPTAIYTSTDQKNLYITEPAKSRIAVFDKVSGALVKQYTAADFSDIRGISVDADEKNMVVLVKNKIVKVVIK